MAPNIGLPQRFQPAPSQRGPAGAWFIAPPRRTDGFHTPVLGVFMDSLPVKQVRGHIPWAPEVLPCSKEHLQPFLPPRRGSPLDSFAVLPSCCACPLIDGMRAGPWQ